MKKNLLFFFSAVILPNFMTQCADTKTDKKADSWLLLKNDSSWNVSVGFERRLTKKFPEGSIYNIPGEGITIPSGEIAEIGPLEELSDKFTVQAIAKVSALLGSYIYKKKEFKFTEVTCLSKSMYGNTPLILTGTTDWQLRAPNEKERAEFPKL